MRRWMHVITPCVLLAVLSCSEDDPALTAPTPDGPALRATYFTIDGGQPRAYTTDGSLLAIRFREGISPFERQMFLTGWNLEVDREFTIFNLTMVRTEDAFTVTPKLWRAAHIVEYVGPVFSYGMCNGRLQVQMPGNEFIVRADRSNEEFLATIAAANATVVRERPDDPDHGLYAVPWGDAGALFDLTVALSANPAVEYAHPNFMLTVCLYEPSQSWELLQ